MVLNKYKINLLAIVLLVMINTNYIYARNFYVSIVRNAHIKPHQLAIEGFLNALDEKGYKIGREVILKYYDAEENENSVLNIADKIKDTKPDLIFTLGTKTTKIIKQNIKDINMVFALVLNPVENEIVNNVNNPGANVTGSSMDIPAANYFNFLKEAFPKIKRIGVIYDPKNLNEFIKDAFESARGLNLDLVRNTISSSKDVPEALSNIIKEIDALWIVADVSVVTGKSLEYMLKFSLENKIPVIAYTGYVVKIGALFSFDCDFEDIGRQAGELSIKVFEGKSAGSLAVTSPRKTRLTINSTVASFFGFQIPEYSLKKAAEIIK